MNRSTNPIPYPNGQTYRDYVLHLRKTRQLHPKVLARLSMLLARAFPQAQTVCEVHGTPGGRNDLIQFFSDGRRTVFELFATYSQVPQDLRLLEQCEADVRIAVLLDDEVDSRVSTEFFRKKPNHFPYIPLRVLLQSQYADYAVMQLRELTDENSSVRRIRQLLSSPRGRLIDDALTRLIDQMERQSADGHNQTLPPPLNGYQYGSLLVIQTIHQLGAPFDRLRALYLWLTHSIEHAFLTVACGLHPFLITDLRGHHAIWAAGDLADAVLIGPASRVAADVLVDLHPIVNHVRSVCGLERKEVTWAFFHSYKRDHG